MRSEQNRNHANGVNFTPFEKQVGEDMPTMLAKSQAAKGFQRRLDIDQADECCASCMYWDGMDSPRRTASSAMGKCRRFPPVMTASARTEWPLTESLDWCGEHDNGEAFKVASDRA